MSCKRKGKFHRRIGHEDLEAEDIYNSTLSLTSALDGRWVVNATPRPLLPGKGPVSQCV